MRKNKTTFVFDRITRTIYSYKYKKSYKQFNTKRNLIRYLEIIKNWFRKVDTKKF